MRPEEAAMTALGYLVPIGLMLDIVGFLLVVRYGHALFLHAGSGPPDNAKGKDGDWYAEMLGEDIDAADTRLKRKAKAGVCLVVIGFVLQIVGSLA